MTETINTAIFKRLLSRTPPGKETLRIAMAGHVDHGKSTLIGRLLLETGSLTKDKLAELRKISKEFGRENELAYLTDQLKEERQRNITIDTTEIFLKTRRRRYCLIDNPGHLEFIKNMLTGAGRAEAAVLIVDAREGIKDQTLRHAYLLKLLALPQLIVVMNKMDLLEYDKKAFHHICVETATLLESLGLEANHLIPVSAKSGDNVTRKSKNMPWYDGPCLLEALSLLPGPESDVHGPLRLPVQDIRVIEGQPLVLGRVASGTLRQEEKVRIFPSKEETVVSGIHVFPGTKEQALNGENVALSLSPAVTVRRGSIIAASDSACAATASFTGNIFWMSAQPLEKDQEITLKCSTQTARAKVEAIEQRIDPGSLHIIDQDNPRLENNEAGLIHFRLLDPLFTEVHTKVPELGRYVVERDDILLAAGTVLEKHES